MSKKNRTVKNDEAGCLQKKEQILQLCYDRLKELLPECSNEVTLLKCIEILEKQAEKLPDKENKNYRIVSETLERMSTVKHILSDTQDK